MTRGWHLLSCDVEEYFQVEAAARIAPDQWDDWPRRAGPRVDQILQLLAEHGATATFFVLGWVAQREPDVIRRIARAGHEVASHGMSHRMITRLDPAQLLGELTDSRKLLEDLTGQPVLGYRAPTFSITHRTAWAIDVLVEAGFVYDSSVFPVHHDRYGVPDAPPEPHRAIGPAGRILLEIPPLTLRVGSRTNVPVGGGGYLRLLPVRAVAYAIRRTERRGLPAMIYLHPWELDPDQPILPMGRLSRWRHRVNLGRTAAKLGWLLTRFRFHSVRQCLESWTARGGKAFGKSKSFQYGQEASRANP